MPARCDHPSHAGRAAFGRAAHDLLVGITRRHPWHPDPEQTHRGAIHVEVATEHPRSDRWATTSSGRSTPISTNRSTCPF